MTALERRCRLLLRAYPAAYRRERGKEILDTLLENTPPSRRWPSPREGRALLVGGLRVRSGLNQRLTMAAHLRLATVLGLALMLLRLTAADLTHRIVLSRHAHVALPDTRYAVASLVLTLAVVAAAFSRHGRSVRPSRWLPPGCGSGETVTTGRGSWPRSCWSW